MADYTIALQLRLNGQDMPIYAESGDTRGAWTLWSALDRITERFKADIGYEPQVNTEWGYDWREEAERRLQQLKASDALRKTYLEELEELREEHDQVLREFDVVVDERDAALMKVAAYEQAVAGNKVAG